MYEKNLKKILQVTQSSSTLKFVVVASCHSECCGKIFLSAGVEHVVCIDKSKKLQDEAAILFSRRFYSYIFTSAQVSICKAFESAKQDIEIRLGREEANKYKLLTRSDHQCPDENPIFKMMEHGEIDIVKNHPVVLKIPSKV